MALDDLKQELVSFIENTNDEVLLSLLKKDFLFYGKVEEKDITDGLSDEQIRELKELSEEDETKDSISLEEFKSVTQQWRIK